jgi:hypothetical protein
VRSQLQQFAQQRREKLDAWLKSGGTFFQPLHLQIDKILEQKRKDRWVDNEPKSTVLTPTSIRLSAKQAVASLGTNQNSMRVSRILLWADLVASSVGPILWVLWAFVMRGGVSYRLAGIALVRNDGRPAERIRCLGRALLVWAPLAALLIMSYWVDDWYWRMWDNNAGPSWMPWLSTCLWWGAWLLCGAYVALAVRSPTRSLHDSLVGTYLVPSR